MLIRSKIPPVPNTIFEYITGNGWFLGFRCQVDENCVLLGYCAASSGKFLPTFRDIHYWLCNNPEERISRITGKFKSYDTMYFYGV